MTTITLKISEQDKRFLKAMAKFEGVSLSELVREKTLKALEDEYDARVADTVLEEFETSGEEARPFEELVEELGFEDILAQNPQTF
ncbi:MAG: DUF6290 family protein [Streptococcaceae bacterium]|jgi:hypothetical protein|nr:DUF6290 family protein [Streptococcaceae bacterium]